MLRLWNECPAEHDESGHEAVREAFMAGSNRARVPEVLAGWLEDGQQEPTLKETERCRSKPRSIRSAIGNQCGK